MYITFHTTQLAMGRLQWKDGAALNPYLTRHHLLCACRDPAEYLKILDVNVVGPLRVTQALLPLLLKKDTRKVINISSTLGSISTNRWAWGEGGLQRAWSALLL